MAKVEYKASVEKDLKKLDRVRRDAILDAVDDDLAQDPKTKGKPLKGSWAGLWSYEVWPYRVIYAIRDDDSILVVRVGHRKDVYR